MKKKNNILRLPYECVRNNLTKIIFGLYFFVLILLSIFEAKLNGAKVGLVLFLALGICTVFLLVPKIHRAILKISFNPPIDITKKQKIKIFALISGISFFVLLICYVGNYPGSFSPDSIDQTRQAMTGVYNDWHPTWHTLLFFTIPLKLSGGWFGSVVLFQIILFSLFMGYFALTVYSYAGSFYTWLGSALILFSPFTLEIVMYPWKDVGFAITAGVCMLYGINIYFSKGEWSKKLYRIILLSFMLATTTILRHNGILFTFFLILALFFFMQKRQWIFMFFFTIGIFFAIKIPLYSHLNVKTFGTRLDETTGLPLSIILNVAKTYPDRINEQTTDFVSEVTKKLPNWKSNHYLSLNSIKFTEGGLNGAAVNKAGVINILKMTLHCFIVAPKEALKTFFGITTQVYGLEIAARAPTAIADNDLGITYNGVSAIKSLQEDYAEVVAKSPLRYIFSSIGATILIMLSFMLFKTNFKSLVDWKRLFLCFPIFTYNFGTMLFLSGSDIRFFYVSILIYPLVVLIMAAKRPNEIRGEENNAG